VAQEPAGGRDGSPHYSGACIPIRAYVDCSEITARNFRVVDEDVYGLDAWAVSRNPDSLSVIVRCDQAAAAALVWSARACAGVR
jgi:hypothetical protein